MAIAVAGLFEALNQLPASRCWIGFAVSVTCLITAVCNFTGKKQLLLLLAIIASSVLAGAFLALAVGDQQQNQKRQDGHDENYLDGVHDEQPSRSLPPQVAGLATQFGIPLESFRRSREMGEWAFTGGRFVFRSHAMFQTIPTSDGDWQVSAEGIRRAEDVQE